MKRKKPAVQHSFGKTEAQAAETVERDFPGNQRTQLSFLQCRKPLYCWMESPPQGSPSISEDAVKRGKFASSYVSFLFSHREASVS